MDWYYEKDGQQAGPVGDPELQSLLRSGRISPATLVWNQTMASWEPYSKAISGAAPSDPSQVRCAECGMFFPRGDVISYSGAFVCAACKPAFFQKVKEGVAVGGMLEYGGFWIRFLAKLIDGVILWIANTAVNFAVMMPLGALGSRGQFGGLMITYAVNITIGASYVTFFLGKYGATPGKMATRLRVVRPDGSPITYMRALGRHFAEILSSMILLIGYIMAAFDDERRTLHDRICDTRVIRL
ncbi:MAG: RDD family protein [Verrucomicrobiae bacterium]|nr:RDD family protein [Verrucomicrobiae bacterium]